MTAARTHHEKNFIVQTGGDLPKQELSSIQMRSLGEG